jgi:hypothetical protein
MVNEKSYYPRFCRTASSRSWLGGRVVWDSMKPGIMLLTGRAALSQGPGFEGLPLSWLKSISKDQ